MPKLTPTFNDDPVLRIVPPHEPLKDEPMEVVVEPPDIHLKPDIVDVISPCPDRYEVNDPHNTPEKQAEWAANATEKPVEAPTEAKDLKVAVIGTAPSSRMLAPYSDPSWQIWACSPGNMNVLPRVDRWFELHTTLHWPENLSYGKPYLEWLRTLKIPVYAQELYARPGGELPNAIVYPHKKMVEEFGPYFFTSSFSWMIALAMSEGANDITLFGVDMASRDEYILQRPGAYFFFMEAKRRGIRIGAPYESDILQPPPLYGFVDSTSLGRKLAARDKELKDRCSALRGEINEKSRSLTYLEGALEDLDYIHNIWGGAQQF